VPLSHRRNEKNRIIAAVFEIPLRGFEASASIVQNPWCRAKSKLLAGDLCDSTIPLSPLESV
jgi:hypothetical protein